MKSTNRLRALVASAAALATVAAGLALVTAAPAQAAPATALRLQAVYPTDASGSAGTCQIYRAFPTDFAGNPSTDTGTVFITLSESPSSSAQDVDFCIPPTAPDGLTGPRVTSATYNFGRQRYTPGRSVSTTNAETGATPDPTTGYAPTELPDLASDVPSSTGTASRSNPTGSDTGSVEYKNGQFVEFGVAGLVPGAATINAYIDFTTSVDARPLPIRFTAGGKPQSVPAYDSTSSVTPDRQQYSAVQSTSTPALIDIVVANAAEDTVFDVTPSFQVTSGPNASANLRSCPATSDFGRSQCSFIGTQPGTDTIVIWVNHSAPPGGIATPGPDAGEPTSTITVTTFTQPSQPGAARFVDLTPNSPVSTTAGSSRVFSATVTDAGGAPVLGASVAFSETGPGQLDGGNSPDGNNSTLTRNTGPDGRTSVTVVTRFGESGTETVTAAIASSATDCGRLFNGQTGVCSDSSTNTITAGSSPSPSASSSTSATPTRSASATPTATMSSSATPTASTSSSSTPLACQAAQVNVNTPTINATGLASVTVFGATPNSRVELQGYSQDHFGGQSFANDPTPVDRAGTADSSGTITFNDLRPSSNTRLRARQVGCAYGDSAVINVRTTIFLKVTRTGARTYLFDVDSVPARPGGLIVSLYRITGQTCAAGVEPRDCPGEQFISQTRVSEVDGSGARTLRFDASYGGREQFVLKTGRDAQSAPGRSNVRDLSIF